MYAWHRGPFITIITALTGKYAADKKGKLGESSIAVGRIASPAGKKAKEERLGHKLKALFSKNDPQRSKN